MVGQAHAGYLYSSTDVATKKLTEKIAVPNRAYTIVAEDKGDIVGFAAAAPQSLPGIGQIDRSNMLLNYLAVDPARRREGIGSVLIAEIERRSKASLQHVIVAHVSHDEAATYRANGWTVLEE